jgi:hypothetical protein
VALVAPATIPARMSEDQTTFAHRRVNRADERRASRAHRANANVMSASESQAQVFGK